MPTPDALVTARTDLSGPQRSESVLGLPSRALLAKAIVDDVLGEFPVVAVRGGRDAAQTAMREAVAAKLREAGRLALPLDHVAGGSSAGILKALLAAFGAGGGDQGQPLHLLRRILARPGLPDVVLLLDDAETLPASLFRFMDALLKLAGFTSAKLRIVLFGALGPWPGLNSPELCLLWQEDMCSIHYLPPLSPAEAASLGVPARTVQTDSRPVADTPARSRPAGSDAPGRTPYRTRRAVRPWVAVAACLVIAVGLGTAVLHPGARMPENHPAPPLDVPPARTASLAPAVPPPPAAPPPPYAPPADEPGVPASQPPASQPPASQPVVEAPSSPASKAVPPDDAVAAQTPAPSLLPDPPRDKIAKSEAAAPERAPPDRASASQLATANRPSVHGLVFIAQPGDTLATLFSQVYRNLAAPPFADVLAVNPAPIRPGVLVMFPEPPGGWTRTSPDLRGGMRSAARGNLP